MIVSRFTIFTEMFVICCYQVTKILCTRYGSSDASSARGPYNLGPLTDLAISVSSEVCLPKSSRLLNVALKTLHERNLRVSLCVQELHHPPNFL